MHTAEQISTRRHGIATDAEHFYRPAVRPGLEGSIKPNSNAAANAEVEKLKARLAVLDRLRKTKLQPRIADHLWTITRAAKEGALEILEVETFCLLRVAALVRLVQNATQDVGKQLRAARRRAGKSVQEPKRAQKRPA